MKKILVVDDTEVWRRLSFNLLSEAGYQVVEAKSGERAIEGGRSNSQLDRVSMDFRMPKLNGIDTASKQHSRRRKALSFKAFEPRGNSNVRHRAGAKENFSGKTAKKGDFLQTLSRCV